MTRQVRRYTAYGSGTAIAYRGARALAKAAYNNRSYLSGGSNNRRMNPSGHGRSMAMSSRKKEPPNQKKTANFEKRELNANPHSIQLTSFSHYHPTKLAEYVKISPPAYYSWDDQAVQVGLQGGQFFYNLPRTIADFAMVQTLNQTASTGSTESQLFLEYVDQKTMITNFSTAVNEITIWELLVKDNLGGGFNSVELIQAGYNAKYNISGSTLPLLAAGDPFLRIFSNPLESEPFRQYYKVEKMQKVTLKPGETHKHHKYIQYNKIWKSTMGSAGAIGGGGSSPVFVKGWTRLTLIQANGTCCTDGAGAASITKVEHAIVQSTNLRYRTPQGKSTNISIGAIDGSKLSSSIVLKNTIAETGTQPNVL